MLRAIPSSDTADGTETLLGVRRAEFPWADDVTYLNNAAIGPLPMSTVAAMDAFTRKRQQPHLTSDPELQHILTEGRATVARLLNATAGEITLTTNTSYGLNQAAGALPLRAGDVVVLSEGEFPANVYPWLRLAGRGIRTEIVPLTERGWPDEDRLLERVADPTVRVLAISHVQFATGYRADLDRLGAACRAHGTFLVVDGIQGVGHLPLDVQATPVDMIACGAQKWLLAPWGAGFLYVRQELITQLEPPVTGWMAFRGTDDFTRLTEYDAVLLDDARRFEMVTLPFQDVLAMTTSVSLLLAVGIDRIPAHVRQLRAPLEEAAARGVVSFVSPMDPHHDSAVICVRPRNPAAAHAALREANVICAVREGNLRLSPHLYNTATEMARVAELLAGA